MQKETIQTLTENFESHAHESNDGIEFCLARDLQQLLGYTKWDNFQSVITKAKIFCEVSASEKDYEQVEKEIKILESERSEEV